MKKLVERLTKETPTVVAHVVVAVAEKPTNALIGAEQQQKGHHNRHNQQEEDEEDLQHKKRKTKHHHSLGHPPRTGYSTGTLGKKNKKFGARNLMGRTVHSFDSAFKELSHGLPIMS